GQARDHAAAALQRRADPARAISGRPRAAAVLDLGTSLPSCALFLSGQIREVIMQTDALQPIPSTLQPHSLVASDRVEGTPVRRSDGSKVGTIKRLMIDKHSGSVAYAVLSFGGFLGVGRKHLPIPWARLNY